METGILKRGMLVSVAPPSIVTEVQSIEMHHETLDGAFCDLSLSLSLICTVVCILLQRLSLVTMSV